MDNIYSNVACGGMDVHYKFSNVTFRDKDGRVVRRERFRHPPRDQLRERLSRWPRGIPVVLEASFGWGWLSDLLSEAGLDPHLSNCYKLEQMRKARGWVKTNKKDADIGRILHRQLGKTALINRLKKIDGFGLILSHVLAAEIGKIERFRNNKALASYSLLTPRSNDTGEDDPDHSPRGRHLGTRGNRTLKWAFIEAAHGAVRSGGRYYSAKFAN